MQNRCYRMNGEEKEFPGKEIKFSDFLMNLSQSLRQSEQVISLIKIDGKEITDEQESFIKDKTMMDLGDVEIFTSSPMELAHETLTTLDQYTAKVVETLQKAADGYRNKNYMAADAYFVRAVDSLDLFIQTIGGIKLALRVGLHTRIALVEASLVSIMNDLLNAKRENNYIFLAELLEKDLVDNLTEWKNDIFPILKNWKVS